ncbi:MAG: DNA polymerase IV [Zetaproteobacteria bacterium]|nr:MAG: DNA polymerase IV [Zetaproteobacteria bacterium]
MKRLLHDWPQAIAHVDADCFYVSCELTRRPGLVGRPVAVMSSQDACIVAKSYAAKARGITTGMPVWEAKRRLPGLELLPADFRFYGLMSRRMFQVLSRFSPVIERYSIDECFMDMQGLRGLFRCGYAELARRMRRAVNEELGITVSVGISVNKLLAKMASSSNKPDGSTIVPGRRLEAFLAKQNCAQVPGIGAKRASLLCKFDLHTARDLACADMRLVRRLLGKAGLDLWRELNGDCAFPLTTGERLPKSMARTASLGRRTRKRKDVAQALAYHAFRLCMDLQARELVARRLRVSIRLGNFEHVHVDVPLPGETADYRHLIRAAMQGLHALWRPDTEAGGCGLIALRLDWANSAQQRLFAEHEEQLLPLWQAMAHINRRYGRGTILPAAAAEHASATGAQPRFRYPLLRAGPA